MFTAHTFDTQVGSVRREMLADSNSSYFSPGSVLAWTVDGKRFAARGFFKRHRRSVYQNAVILVDTHHRLPFLFINNLPESTRRDNNTSGTASRRKQKKKGKTYTIYPLLTGPSIGGGEVFTGILIGLFNKPLTFRMCVSLLTMLRSNTTFSCLKTDSISRRSVSNPSPSRSPSKPGAVGSSARAHATPASPQASASRALYRMTSSRANISEASDTGLANRGKSASVPSQRNFDSASAWPFSPSDGLPSSPLPPCASQDMIRTACMVAGCTASRRTTPRRRYRHTSLAPGHFISLLERSASISLSCRWNVGNEGGDAS